MSNRISIDEIREDISVLEHDAEALYRYNTPVESEKLLNRISLRDKKRLLYWAISEGNKDVSNVANHFIEKLNLSTNNYDKFPLQMPEEDYLYIEKIRKQIHESTTKKKILTEYEQELSIEVLSEACGKIGFLTIERAYWILFPHDYSEGPDWIECSDGDASEQSAFQVTYAPNKKEKVRLLELMREASWVMHLHNHPLLPSEAESLDFSKEDREFAKYWELLRPELAYKMFWGVIQKNQVHGIPFNLPFHMTPSSPEQPDTPNPINMKNEPESEVVDGDTLYEEIKSGRRKTYKVRQKEIEDSKQTKRNFLRLFYTFLWTMLIIIILIALAAIIS